MISTVRTLLRVLRTMLTGISLLLLVAVIAAWVSSWKTPAQFHFFRWQEDQFETLYGPTHFGITARSGVLRFEHIHSPMAPPAPTGEQLTHCIDWYTGPRHLAERCYVRRQCPIVLDEPEQVWQNWPLVFRVGLHQHMDGCGYDMRVISVRCWFAAIVFSVLPISRLAIWRRRRLQIAAARRSRCTNCGYDLRATPERCPECGTTPRSIP